MLLPVIPVAGKRHGDGYRPFGLNVNVHAAAVRTRAIDAARVVVRRIELRNFIAGADPVEHFVLRKGQSA